MNDRKTAPSLVRLLTPAEAAPYFGVDPKTLVRWANDDRFPEEFEGRPVIVRTRGGHHRFNEKAVLALQAGKLSWVKAAAGETL